MGLKRLALQDISIYWLKFFTLFAEKRLGREGRQNPMNTRQQEKLINAIIYFVNNTTYCNKVKLFKLLYLSDFKHFHETGKSITGLDYYAWLKGPVPLALKSTIQEILRGDNQEEGESPLKDILNSNFSFSEESKSKKLTVTPKTQFDSEVFTRREYKLLQSIANEYKDTMSEEMILATHENDGPWDITYRRQPDERIDYFLALNSGSPLKKEEIQEREYENKMIRMSFGLK
jgi:uncharacterized phage-associated protein